MVVLSDQNSLELVRSIELINSHVKDVGRLLTMLIVQDYKYKEHTYAEGGSVLHLVIALSGGGVLHLLGSFSWVRLGSGPLHPEGLYLGWGQGPTPSTAFGDRMGSSPPPGVESVSMTIGPRGPYQVSYLIPSILFTCCIV
ncbi:unnamed protein product [Brassica oleracea var. botrytis]